ncbi:hypothetical protein BCV70DRAFT_202011 [Testicularia cyperi]|uniref:PCI domain-containing protein n=1 Tax=Testicularia cyperi TaxID=1882483 RepID=A0A317XIW4_9BASI|nr:hypothetical protein BCV70DRAFT_202011 [Testicularia cyperi]
MRPAVFADAVIAAAKAQDGHTLAQLYAIGGPIATAVMMELGDPRPHKIVAALRKCTGYLSSPWEEMSQHHLLSVYYFSLASALQLHSSPQARSGMAAEPRDQEGKTRADRLAQSFEEYNAALSVFLRYFSGLNQGRWAIPLLRILCLNLRWLAVQADEAALESYNLRTHSGAAAAGSTPFNNGETAEEMGNGGSNSSEARTSSVANRRLEECARALNKAFTACIADRSPDLETSRKWGTYEVVGMVFKTYFRLKSLSLCRNILRAIDAAALPPLDAFPRSQRVTFAYYTGVLAFVGEEYEKAEERLLTAWTNCHCNASTNQRLILTYLIPARLLLRGSMPSRALLCRYPTLEALYSPLLESFVKGDVKHYDLVLGNPEVQKRLVKSSTYIAFENARNQVLRTLFKQTYLVQNKPSRIHINAFLAATKVFNLSYSAQEIEWLIATLIYKGYIKGYIAHERGILVLSATNPFPKLGSFAVAPS